MVTLSIENCSSQARSLVLRIFKELQLNKTHVVIIIPGILEAGMGHRLSCPLPQCSKPLNSTLINLAAQSLALFFILFGKELQAGLQVAHRSFCVAADVNQLLRTRQSKP